MWYCSDTASVSSIIGKYSEHVGGTDWARFGPLRFPQEVRNNIRTSLLGTSGKWWRHGGGNGETIELASQN